jgi:pimeloyl-ACP methyl ester carboxylesterase
MPSSYLLIKDLRVHYLHWNLDGAGRQVLLLHGLASNARIWELTTPDLQKQDMVLIAPDLRGHGLTDKPGGVYDLETYLHDLAAFANATNFEQPLIVGHSWGALLALEFAARFPFGPLAPAGIVLVDGGMTQLDQAKQAGQLMTFEQMRAQMQPPDLDGTPLETFLAHLEAGDQDWKADERVVRIILSNFKVTQQSAPDEAREPIEVIHPHLSREHHMQIVRSMWEYPTYRRFSLVRCPVLMVPAQPPPQASDRDREYLIMKREGILKAQETIDDLQLHWLENSVHDIPLQHPQALAEIIAQFNTSLE